MSSRIAALVLIGGISLLAASIPRSHPRPPARRIRATERPWLTRDVQDQLIGPAGTLGPLFAGVTLGGSAPLPEVQDEIARFAKAHDVTIRLEIVDDTLVAIRVSITFGGCCGYEAADVLAMRLSRPRRGACCDCRGEWVDDWAYSPEPGVQLRASVQVNRIALRWEPALAPEELLGEADGLSGANVQRLVRTRGDRLIDLGEHEYRLELPEGDDRREPWESAVRLSAHAGVVTQVAFDFQADDVAALLRARWGRPHVARDDEFLLTWHRGDRMITARIADERVALISIDRPDEEAATAGGLAVPERGAAVARAQ